MFCFLIWKLEDSQETKKDLWVEDVPLIFKEGRTLPQMDTSTVDISTGTLPENFPQMVRGTLSQTAEVFTAEVSIAPNHFDKKCYLTST